MKLGILLSGRGSNFEAIAQNVLTGKLKAEIGFVFSNKPDAPGLKLARQLGFKAEALEMSGLDRAEYDGKVAELLLKPWSYTGLPGRLHAPAQRTVCFAISRSHSEHPSVPAARLPWFGRPISGPDPWCEDYRLYGPFRR